MRRLAVLVAAVVLASAPSPADDRDKMLVGLQKDGSILTPTNQLLKPAGTQVLFPGRPVDVVLVDAGKTLVAKNMRGLEVIDVTAGKVTQTLALPAAGKGKGATGSMSATGLIAVDGRLFVTDSQVGVMVAKTGDGGQYEWDGEPLKLPAPKVGGSPYPTGLAADGCSLWVCSNRGNELVRFDLATKKVTAQVKVGVAPYMPVVVGKKVYVSNWGGDEFRIRSSQPPPDAVRGAAAARYCSCVARPPRVPPSLDHAVPPPLAVRPPRRREDRPPVLPPGAARPR